MTQSTGESLEQSKVHKLGELIFSQRIWIGLVFAVLGGIFVRSPSGFVQHDRPIAAGSLLLVLGGLAIRAWGSGSAGDHTRLKNIEVPQLVTCGPYAYVRHPIYFGTMVLGLGMVGILGEWGLLFFYAAACLALYTTMIPAEEAYLRATFGREYDAYCAEVPQIIPRLRSLRTPADRRFSWRSAAGEWQIALVLLLIYGGFRALPV